MAYFKKGLLLAFVPVEIDHLSIRRRISKSRRPPVKIPLKVLRPVIYNFYNQLKVSDSGLEPVLKPVRVKDYIDYETDYHGLLLSTGIIIQLPAYGSWKLYLQPVFPFKPEIDQRCNCHH